MTEEARPCSRRRGREGVPPESSEEEMRFVNMFRRSALVMGGPLLLLAACSTPTDSVAPLQSEALSFQAPEAIATELANPRGITVTPDGAILVAEAGSGGDGPHFMGGEGSELHFGTTGAVTRIDTNGQRRVLEGLPSLAAEDGTRAVGPNDISLLGNGTTYIATGLAPTPPSSRTWASTALASA